MAEENKGLPFGTLGAAGGLAGLAYGLLNSNMSEYKGKERLKSILRATLLGGLTGLGVDTGLYGLKTLGTPINVEDYLKEDRKGAFTIPITSK